ncbi:MAG: hypothetical protein ACK53L_15075, partial [Pirellulaceae bacterium]
SSGFLPRVQPIYSCKISRLEFGEKTYASKGQKTTLAIVKTYDGSVLNFVSASGFIPGIVCAVSASSTALGIIALR